MSRVSSFTQLYVGGDHMRQRHMALEVLLNGFFFLFADWKIPREGLGIRLCLSYASLVCLSLPLIVMKCSGSIAQLFFIIYSIAHLQIRFNANEAYTGIEKLTHIVFIPNTNRAWHFLEQMKCENICTSIEFDIAMFNTRIYSIWKVWCCARSICDNFNILFLFLFKMFSS